MVNQENVTPEIITKTKEIIVSSQISKNIRSRRKVADQLHKNKWINLYYLNSQYFRRINMVPELENLKSVERVKILYSLK